MLENEMKLGRLVGGPVANIPKLRDYITDAAAFDYAPPARDYIGKLQTDPYGNDSVGDCTVASLYCRSFMLGHIHGRPFTGTAAMALADYKACSSWNGVVGDPSDTGTHMSTVIQYAMTHGLSSGDKFGACVAVDTSDFVRLRACINAFSGVYVGGNLPVAFTSDDRWDLPANPASNLLPVSGVRGHSFYYAGYDRLWLKTARGVWVSNEWNATCVNEAYVIIDDELLQGNLPAPSGFDMARLKADMAGLRVQ